MRYPSAANGGEEKRLPDLSPNVRGGKGAYWCTFGKDADWMEKLLEVLSEIETLN